ncbi:MAG: arginine--tRNA ligase [Bacteroidales bacterium]|nr:arginine--tRNA ligase [Bacteroidales bacterium]
MNIELIIKEEVAKAIKEIYEYDIKIDEIQFQKTRRDFKGNYTIVVFPFLRFSKKSPEQTGNEIGLYLKNNTNVINDYNVIKGFLNLIIDTKFWIDHLNYLFKHKKYGIYSLSEDRQKIMIEFSSPNTNKPLHLGHIRNNLLGHSVAEILKANGHDVTKVNLINDRGIHICKSMLAWKKWGENKTPEKTGIKGDKFVGDYYVKFNMEFNEQVNQLINKGIDKNKAEKEAQLLKEAQDILRKWESNDKEVFDLWNMMNNWVYKGFDITYKNLGINFDKIYYESETYKLGKKIVEKGLEDGVLLKKEDGSVWANLTDVGLDEKLLLRADGTSVYITQDLGTAHQRFSEFDLNESIYVVGNEQNYHFQILKLILKKLGYNWAENINHLSYGMVELPSGKMKSREGKVVDADDLMQEMIDTAREMSSELGKLEDYSKEEAEKVYKIIALGALKYFILKVDPKKNMMFDPKESIDFNGNTGPFIQYTHARIKSVLKKAEENKIKIINEISKNIDFNEKEIDIIRLICEFPMVIKEAGNTYSPAVIANYVYELVKEYNQFYHDYSILKEPDDDKRNFRLLLSDSCGKIILYTLNLLGIEAPDRM